MFSAPTYTILTNIDSWTVMSISLRVRGKSEVGNEAGGCRRPDNAWKRSRLVRNVGARDGRVNAVILSCSAAPWAGPGPGRAGRAAERRGYPSNAKSIQRLPFAPQSRAHPMICAALRCSWMSRVHRKRITRGGGGDTRKMSRDTGEGSTDWAFL